MFNPVSNAGAGPTSGRISRQCGVNWSSTFYVFDHFFIILISMLHLDQLEPSRPTEDEGSRIGAVVKVNLLTGDIVHGTLDWSMDTTFLIK